MPVLTIVLWVNPRAAERIRFEPAGLIRSLLAGLAANGTSQFLSDVIGQAQGQCDDSNRREIPASCRKYRAAAHIQVFDPMNAAVAIDDAEFGRIVHACRSHVVPSAFLTKGVGPLSALDWRIEHHIRYSGKEELSSDQREGAIKGSLDQGIQPPFHPDTIHTKLVSLLR